MTKSDVDLKDNCFVEFTAGGLHFFQTANGQAIGRQLFSTIITLEDFNRLALAVVKHFNVININGVPTAGVETCVDGDIAIVYGDAQSVSDGKPLPQGVFMPAGGSTAEERANWSTYWPTSGLVDLADLNDHTPHDRPDLKPVPHVEDFIKESPSDVNAANISQMSKTQLTELHNTLHDEMKNANWKRLKKGEMAAYLLETLID